MLRLRRREAWAFVEILRPKQWYKNLLLFVALVFSYNLGDLSLIESAVFGFLIFCALSSSMYIVNDIIDREKDLSHPKKCRRPIPSGRINVRSARVYAAILFGGGLLGAFLISVQFFLMSLAYVFVATLYTTVLKRYAIVDALGLGAGFVVRAFAGAIIVSVPVSPWLVICVFLLALVLAFGKRRHELVMLGEEAVNHRVSLTRYSVHLTEDLMLTSTATLIMAYSMYTFLAASEWMMITIPLVIFGLFRFVFLMHSAEEGGEVDIIFKDIPSLFNIVIWIALCVIVLYFSPSTAGPIGG